VPNPNLAAQIEQYIWEHLTKTRTGSFTRGRVSLKWFRGKHEFGVVGDGFTAAIKTGSGNGPGGPSADVMRCYREICRLRLRHINGKRTVMM
jgi:hypothetical protein